MSDKQSSATPSSAADDLTSSPLAMSFRRLPTLTSLRLVTWYFFEPKRIAAVTSAPQALGSAQTAAGIAAALVWLPLALLNLAAIVRAFPMRSREFGILPYVGLVLVIVSWRINSRVEVAAQQAGAEADPPRYYFFLMSAAVTAGFAILADTPGFAPDLPIAIGTTLALSAWVPVTAAYGFEQHVATQTANLYYHFLLLIVAAVSIGKVLGLTAPELAGNVLLFIIAAGPMIWAAGLLALDRYFRRSASALVENAQSAKGIILRIMTGLMLLAGYGILIWSTFGGGWRIAMALVDEEIVPLDVRDTEGDAEEFEGALAGARQVSTPVSGTPALVTAVPDGASLRVIIDGTATTVNYAGIRVEPIYTDCGRRAHAMNESLVGGQAVTLVDSRSEGESDGPLRRYVYLAQGGTSINVTLVQLGLADVELTHADSPFFSELLMARTMAASLPDNCQQNTP